MKRIRVTEEMVDIAERAWDRTANIWWKTNNHSPVGAADRACMNAAIYAVLTHILREKALKRRKRSSNPGGSPASAS
jgi:hypothetical protein